MVWGPPSTFPHGSWFQPLTPRIWQNLYGKTHPLRKGRGPPTRKPSPSVLILSAVRTRAKRVALKVTVPSLFKGMFMPTRRCEGRAVTGCGAGTRPGLAGHPSLVRGLGGEGT